MAQHLEIRCIEGRCVRILPEISAVNENLHHPCISRDIARQNQRDQGVSRDAEANNISIHNKPLNERAVPKRTSLLKERVRP